MLRTLVPLLCFTSLLCAQVNRSGPCLPTVKGAQKAPRTLYWVTYGMRAVLRDIPGASVVVEDVMPEILPQTAPRLSVFHVNFSFQREDQGLDPRAARSMPEWQNPGNVRAGGNIIHRSYDIVGAEF